MSDNNTEIFLDFWANFSWPEPKPVFFRLYYDTKGDPVAYSMEDLPGNYIEITADQYVQADVHVRVVNGRIVPNKKITVYKLQPADNGTPCHPADVSIVVDENQPNQRWRLNQ